ncbi:MAG TPA: ABC transporter ATP-binding protein [Mycobacteriales bacterium]|nr:ABC transporter ATP-binding protein [Mycobacteriales bacterium]
MSAGVAVPEAPLGIREGPQGSWHVLRRGLALSPEFREGIGITLVLALVATAGRLVVPVVIQQTLDRGLRTDGGVDVGFVRRTVAIAAAVLVVTALASYLTSLRLARNTERALSALRVRAFRHVHDLSVLHQAAERRGSLVSRVTTDVDTISQFMQFGGLLLVINSGQLLVALAIMTFYSWQLTLLVLAVFVPLVLMLRRTNRRRGAAFDVVRRRVGEVLGAIAESVVAAPVVRAYGVEERTARRIDTAVDRHAESQVHAVKLSATMFAMVEMSAAAASAGVVVLGVLIGVDGSLTAGQLVGFLFLVTFFVGPLQITTEVLSEAQSAISGWRRILGILDTPADVQDPALRAGGGLEMPPGPVGVRFEHVGFRYPSGPPVLHDVDLEVAPQRRVAVVGQTGSGKTTFAKLLTRLMDPSEGRVLLNGVPLADLRFDDLRRRVVMVPQDGFLFDTTIAENVRHGRDDITDDEIELAFTELGLADWLDLLPHGLETRVGERGDSLSVGERQLVALARAYVADPDLLLLDEATSAVDPATEVRLQRALEGVTRGRTAVSIAHRLSTAEAADEVIVFDGGRVVQRGPHRDLVAQKDGVYAGMWASWSSRRRR